MRVDALKLAPTNGLKLADEAGASAAGGKSFGEVLGDALGQVNKLQNDAEQASLNLATGKVQDVSEVIVATEKATVALQLTMQVRNKVVDAYQEIMRMQV